MVILLVVTKLMFINSCQPKARDNYLLKIYEGQFDEPGVRSGYISTDGDTIISLGKYLYCHTDTFKFYAIVTTFDGKLIAIDRVDNKLFEVFWFDNGPDYISDDLFRIVKEGKIGYANSKGEVVLDPQFKCAFPFRNGVAKVAYDCASGPESGHHQWVSENWFYIDKNGKLDE